MSSRIPKVATGLDVLVREGFARLKGQRIGLLAHAASVDRRLMPIWRLMQEADLDVVALFGPEHGLEGALQDMETVGDAGEQKVITGPRIHSLYGDTPESLRPTPAMLEGLDVVVVDLQDVGARYYTFAATMGYLMEVAATAGVRVLVLDRPNPLGGRDRDVEGPLIDPAYHSFVGAYDMPIRHGLTLAEYALYVKGLKKIDVELELIEMEGWRRELDFETTGLPWVLPSPNMPSVETAFIYPGQCLLEGTNLSEGRGTTRPFELCGAPYLSGEAWARSAAEEAGPGVAFRPTTIRPMFQKWAKAPLGAVQIHVLDRLTLRPVQVTIALLRAARTLAPSEFAWRTEKYEFVDDRLAIDLLFGSPKPREAIEAGVRTEEIVRSFVPQEEEFRARRRPFLRYR